jgi:hypothetical protein
VFLNGTSTTFVEDGIAGFYEDKGPATEAELQNPYALAISSDNRFYFSDSANNHIRMICSQCNYTQEVNITMKGTATVRLLALFSVVLSSLFVL